MHDVHTRACSTCNTHTHTVCTAHTQHNVCRLRIFALRHFFRGPPERGSENHCATLDVHHESRGEGKLKRRAPGRNAAFDNGLPQWRCSLPERGGKWPTYGRKEKQKRHFYSFSFLSEFAFAVLPAETGAPQRNVPLNLLFCFVLFSTKNY